MREEWRYAMEDCGEPCVVNIGISQMLKWCVDSLDMKEKVTLSLYVC